MKASYRINKNSISIRVPKEMVLNFINYLAIGLESPYTQIGLKSYPNYVIFYCKDIFHSELKIMVSELNKGWSF